MSRIKVKTGESFEHGTSKSYLGSTSRFFAIYSIVSRWGLQVPFSRFCVSDREMPGAAANPVMDSFL